MCLGLWLVSAEPWLLDFYSRWPVLWGAVVLGVFVVPPATGLVLSSNSIVQGLSVRKAYSSAAQPTYSQWQCRGKQLRIYGSCLWRSNLTFRR